jgi:hypothetical protein
MAAMTACCEAAQAEQWLIQQQQLGYDEGHADGQHLLLSAAHEAGLPGFQPGGAS